MPHEVGTITGVVTEVHPILFCFDVKISNRSIFAPPKATIHMALVCKEPHQSLPKEGTTVTIKSQYFTLGAGFIVAMILTSMDDIVADEFTVASPSREFIQIVENLKLTATDLLQVATHFDNLKRYFKPPDAITTENLLLTVLNALHGCKFELQFLRNIKFLDNARETFRHTYKDFGYWTFGSHYNRKNKCLIGFLFLRNDQTGMVYFTDTNRELPVIFINQKGNETQEFLNQYVIIKEYIIVTEIYNCPVKFTSLEYLLLDLSKVIKLSISRGSSKPVFQSLSEIDNSYKRISCTILSKSLPTAISQTDITHWLEVKMEDNQYGFLCLPTTFKDVFPFLRSGHTYLILYKTQPKKTFNREIDFLSRIGTSQKSVFLLTLAPDTIFIPAASTQSLNFCDVDEAFTKLNSQLSLMSFQGTVSLKLFNNPISSRTSARTNNPYFGTPGSKTPKLRFETGGKFFEVYLNNWENMTLPYGLIPGMKLVVRNVVSQRGKYYKATVLTSFEVVAYEPKIRFETANLWDMHWSVPFYLGTGHLIPSFTVIYGRLLTFSILGLRLFLDQNGLHADISIVGWDNFGESKIIAKGDPALGLMRIFTKLSGEAFNTWCEGCCDLKAFTFCKNRPPEERQGEKGTAHTILYQYIKNLESETFPLDLVCRKMDNEANDIPVYYLVAVLDIHKMRGM